MLRLIKNGAIVEDDYTQVEPSEDNLELPAGNVLVSLPTWQQAREQLIAHDGKIGVTLAPDEFAEAIADDLGHISMVAIRFPAFADGRGYSTAYALRTRYRYDGELRAVGDVFKDTLFYQKRCGFNSFVVREDKNIEEALKGLSFFSESYQASADGSRPLFLRRMPQKQLG